MRAGHPPRRAHKPDVVGDRLTTVMDRLAKAVKHFGQGLKDREDQQDFLSAHDRLATLAGTVRSWLKQDMAECVYWAEKSGRRRPRLKLSAAPVDVGPSLQSLLFSNVPSVITTSATLTVGANRETQTGEDIESAAGNSGSDTDRSFHFFRSRLGLAQTETLALGSPFNYAEQARLVLLDGMPDPASQSSQYEEAAIRMKEQGAGGCIID